MTQPARGTGQQPELQPAETQQRDSQPSEISQSRPAMRFYEPPPLGGDAFMRPSLPVAREGRSYSPRQLVAFCVLGAAAGTAAGLLLLATVMEPKPSPTGVGLAPKASAQVAAPAAAATADDPQPSAAEPETAPAAAAAEEEAPAPNSASRGATREAKPARQGSTRSRGTSHANAKLPERPERGDVIAAMNRVLPAARACLSGRHGMVTADVKIVGSSGRITTAQISGQTGPVGSCIARAVRQAKFPKFKADSISIRYPMAL